MFDNQRWWLRCCCKLIHEGRAASRHRRTTSRPDRGFRSLRVKRFESLPARQCANSDAIVMQEDVTRKGNEIVVNTEVNLAISSGDAACDLAEVKGYWRKVSALRATIAFWRRKHC